MTEALSAGAEVESGIHTAWLETQERRSVAWKEIVISLKGERYAEAILATTEPKIHIRLKVR